MRLRICGARAGLCAAVLAVAGCGGGGFGGGLFEGGRTPDSQTKGAGAESYGQLPPEQKAAAERSTIWDLFQNRDDPNVTIEVNKYIWNATLDVLDFLPVSSADPFSGVLVFGYGTPPGGGRAYRATVYVQDPALDARSLRVALATRAGPAPTATVRAIEDAILTRARQLRIAETAL